MQMISFKSGGLIFSAFVIFSGLVACDKPDTGFEPYPDDLPQVPDVPYTSILGCFSAGIEEKTATVPDTYDEIGLLADSSTARVVIDPEVVVAEVSKFVYGNNVNQYCGDYNLVTHLADYVSLLNPHILRYPGGLHSNEYFWSAQGRANLPSDLPPKLLNGSRQPYTPYWVPGFYGDSWNFNLDDFYTFLKNTSSEALFTVNYSYARYGTGPTPLQTAAHLAAEWVRYDYRKTQELGIPPTRYWEIGNENCASWASGYYIDPALNQDGQPEKITPKLYGQHVVVFADSMRKAAAEFGHTIYIGSQNDVGVFEGAGNSPDWMVDHTYFTPYGQNSNAKSILNSVRTEVAYYPGKTKNETVKNGLPLKPTTMTEWNIFAEGSGQTSSYINGMHAVQVLGEMIKNQYGMGNRWDVVNGWGSKGDDMGMFSLGTDPDGMAGRGNPRAMFYYMYYFQHFMGDKMVNHAMDGATADIIVYPSTFSSGEMGIILMNKGTTAQTVQFYFMNFIPGKRFYYYNLTGGNERSGEASPAREMSWQVFVNGIGPSKTLGGPIEDLLTIKPYSSSMTNTFKIKSPPLSVQFILVEN
jgi:hypothetical protein